MKIRLSELREVIRSCLNEDASLANAIKAKVKFISDDSSELLSKLTWRVAADVAKFEAIQQGRKEAPDDVKNAAKAVAKSFFGALVKLKDDRLQK